MHCSKALLILLACTACAADFSGSSALEFTRKAVAFGQCPPGSAANKRLQAYIETELQRLNCQTSFDAFAGQTPAGSVAMRNIIAKFPGKSGRAIVVTGHFDTKPMPGRVFVGANDGGASTGFLLEFARVVNTMPHADDIYIVFFDGEEAFGEWSDTNGIYGSRHLADKWSRDGMLARIKALINVDMIGDKDLDILEDTNSSRSLLRLVWQTANDLGYGKYFLETATPMEDDHMPFVRKGVNALDLIDFDYGPDNAYWHDEKDTIDKLSAHSFEVVGNVLVAVVKKTPVLMQRIYVIAAGGTIEKVYSEQTGNVQNLDTKIDRYFRLLRLPDADIQVTHLMNKDSLEMTDADRARVLQTVREKLNDPAPIVITHGTDTMIDTGLVLQRSLSDLPVPIVLTGAMTPLGFESSDGLQNLTEALFAVRVLPPGVYIVMHNQVFPVDRARKDRELSRFVWK